VIAEAPVSRSTPVTRLELVPDEHVSVQRLSDLWQRALDAEQRAVDANGLGRGPELQHERAETAQLLAALAHDTGERPAPWLSPVAVTAELLGLPRGTEACLVDLDGVLTDSGALHAAAWAEVFDNLLLQLSDKLGWRFIPFDRDADYAEYIEGRPRLEAIHVFLESRGIRIPEGRWDEGADANTAWGVALRKGVALEHALHSRGVRALPGAHRFLDAAGRAGIGRGVVSASASTDEILERARLDALVEERIDAGVRSATELRSRPAPDVLLFACDRLGVDPASAVAITEAPAGVAAGHAAGMAVIGIGAGDKATLLEGFGADRVVPRLRALLDPRLL
jgi:HAD superfamily hydrolase (TIGR01509 family)